MTTETLPADLAALILRYRGPGIVLYPQTSRKEKGRLPLERLEELAEQGWIEGHWRAYTADDEEIRPIRDGDAWWDPDTGDQIPSDHVHRSFLTLPRAHGTDEAQSAQRERCLYQASRLLDEANEIGDKLGVTRWPTPSWYVEASA